MYNNNIYSIFIVICSINNIQSNRVISEQQIISLFNSLDVVDKKMKEIKAIFRKTARDENDFITMSSFVSIVERNEVIFNNFHESKMMIIDRVIGYEIYQTILQRKKYFYVLSKNKMKIIVPRESCSERVSRLFNYSPPNYYFDYMANDFKESNERYFVSLRRRFGYSKRPNSSYYFSRLQTFSPRSNYSIGNESSYENEEKKTISISKKTIMSESVSGSKSHFSNKILPLESNKSLDK